MSIAGDNLCTGRPNKLHSPKAFLGKSTSAHMASLTTLFFICVLVFLLIRWLSSKPQKFPPGPRRWPVVGNLVEVVGGAYGGVVHEIFIKLSNKWVRTFTFFPLRYYFAIYIRYGPVMGIFLGTQPTIIISDYKAIKELGNRDDLSGRTINKVGQILLKGKKYGKIYNFNAKGTN